MVGILGVLSIFPVAMSSAGKAIGEVRTNILSESAISQLTADCRVPIEEGLAQDSTVDTLVRAASATDNRTGYFVTMTGGPAKGQCRIITGASAETLDVCPNWETVPIPLPETDWVQPGDYPEDRYIITRMGLPDIRDDDGPRDGFVRELSNSANPDIGPNEFLAAQADANTVDALTWSPDWYPTTLPTSGTADSDSAATFSTLSANGSPGWSDFEHRGKLAVIIGPETSPARGQVRLITDNTNKVLNIFPDWAQQPRKNDRFEIRERLGYFVLFTSGRAAGRVLPIEGHKKAADSPVTNGDRITLPKDVDLRLLGITEARRETDSSPDFSARRATTFMILGSKSFLSTVLPNQHPQLSTGQITANNFPPVESYLPNSFGNAKTAEPQTGADIFHEDEAVASASDTKDRYVSIYSSVCIFSDNGIYDSTAVPPPPPPPVRVDVLVFMNFNRADSLQDNRRAVGYMSGQIQRP
jgi:hypothetical protein